MCGRFLLTVNAEMLREAFPQFRFPATYAPRYNIAPGQPVLVVPNDGTEEGTFFLWGLIPSWAKDPSIGNRLINARAETLAQKPSFRAAYRYRRCLILADGFYEWRKLPGKRMKIPYLVRLKSGQPFAFAGLWEEWHAPDGSQVRTCTIITTRPNELVARIHNRMPVILSPDAYATWLSTHPQSPPTLRSLLTPYPAEEMEAYAVSRRVNDARNEGPECIEPLTDDGFALG
ncbi:MAG: SOS response-associated peptidase [Anaerolineae bacterium]|nr:MAG: SOS response-associated peptidase [Anaerolineae bacterium]